MWQSRHEITVKGLRKEQVWGVWVDVNGWHNWDSDIEYAKLNNAFCEGSTFLLKPKGAPKVSLRIVRSEPNKGFTDLTKFPLAKMYGIHDMQETPEGLRITSTIRVEGLLSQLWKKIVAEKVAAGMPAQLEALVRIARAK